VIAALNSPARRLTFAIVVSVLLHAAVLWLPYIHLPLAKVAFPPLSVRLVSLPKHVEPPMASPEPANPKSTRAPNASGKAKAKTMKKMDKTEGQAAAHPFPKRLMLSFVVQKDGDGLMTGEIHHQLEIHGNKYTLKSMRQTAGPASLNNGDQLTQTSRGNIGERGLQPETFEENEINKSGKKSHRATFDWTAQKVRYSHGGESALPDTAQDMLSFMYQISQIPMNADFFPLPITDGGHMEQYLIEIGAQDDISTPMGKLRSLHLRKIHAQGEVYFEIWLAQEYRLFPVKFRQLDGSDNVTDEYVIAEILATDE